MIPKANTLIELLEANRNFPRSVTYVEGENDSREVSCAELYERATGILYHLQKLGARRGDKLILFLSNNEQFIDVFWAAILGGIVPVPVALGISDEHRHKLLRIVRRLGKPYFYTEKRSLERIGAFAAQAGEQALFDALAPLAEDELVAEVRGGVGTMAAIELTAEVCERQPRAAAALALGARAAGIFVRPGDTAVAVGYSRCDANTS